VFRESFEATSVLAKLASHLVVLVRSPFAGSVPAPANVSYNICLKKIWRVSLRIQPSAIEHFTFIHAM
jgi:hypothetical protein